MSHSDALAEHGQLDAGADRSLEADVERALAVLTARQSHLNFEDRRFTPKGIIAVMQELQPGAPSIHRSTLWRNQSIARLIAAARGVPYLEPDFQAFGGWRPPRSFSLRSRAHRRKTLANWTLKALAYELVGLEELERHAETRRHQLETAGWSASQWPADQPYPLDPFTPAQTAKERYHWYWQHLTRWEMVVKVLDLEQVVAEHQAHLVTWDIAYVGCHNGASG